MDITGKTIDHKNIIIIFAIAEVHVERMAWPNIEHAGMADFYPLLYMGHEVEFEVGVGVGVEVEVEDQI